MSWNYILVLGFFLVSSTGVIGQTEICGNRGKVIPIGSKGVSVNSLCADVQSIPAGKASENTGPVSLHPTPSPWPNNQGQNYAQTYPPTSNQGSNYPEQNLWTSNQGSNYPEQNSWTNNQGSNYVQTYSPTSNHQGSNLPKQNPWTNNQGSNYPEQNPWTNVHRSNYPEQYPWNSNQRPSYPEPYPWTNSRGLNYPQQTEAPWTYANPDSILQPPKFGANLPDPSFGPIPVEKCFDEDICYRIPRVFDKEEGLRFLWPGARVHYDISDRFTSEEKTKLEQAFQEFKNKTCVEFVQRDPLRHNKYLHIEADSPPICENILGYYNSGQQLCISRDCFSKPGWILNKLMRAIGFSLEITRADRDNYVTIHYKNIIPGHESIYHVPTCANRHSSIVGYDFGSVLHPDPFGSSQHGQLTFENQPQFKNEKYGAGQREKFSNGDVQKINEMYRCNLPINERDRLKNPDLEVPIVY